MDRQKDIYDSNEPVGGSVETRNVGLILPAAPAVVMSLRKRSEKAIVFDNPSLTDAVAAPNPSRGNRPVVRDFSLFHPADAE